MTTIAELQARAHQLRLIAQRAVSGRQQGLFEERSRGSGLEFDELRAYEPGDNVRTIDWKSSARTGTLMTRLYFEESRRTVFLLIDSSRSGQFGSSVHSKWTVIRECAVLLAYAAQYGGDELGTLFFSDEAGDCRFPMHRFSEVHDFALAALQMAAVAGITQWMRAAAFVTARLPRRSLVIVISDGLAADYRDAVPLLAAEHEVLFVRVSDPAERSWPHRIVVGLHDLESGESLAADPAIAHAVPSFMTDWYAQQEQYCREYNVGLVDILTTDVYEEQLVPFFLQRRGRS